MVKTIIVLFLFANMLMPAYGQEATKADEKETTEEEKAEPAIEDQGFINYGLLSISIGYKITSDERHIIFIIVNNTGKTIDSIYGWVYLVEENKNFSIARKILANNPHKSGILISKRPHKPFTLGTWRFALKRQFPSLENSDYLLRVNNKSIFYLPFEFPEPEAIEVAEEAVTE